MRTPMSAWRSDPPVAAPHRFVANPLATLAPTNSRISPQRGRSPMRPATYSPTKAPAVIRTTIGCVDMRAATRRKCGTAGDRGLEGEAAIVAHSVRATPDRQRPTNGLVVLNYTFRPRRTPSLEDGAYAPQKEALLLLGAHAQALELFGQAHVGVEPRGIGVEVNEGPRPSVEVSPLLLSEGWEPPEVLQ